MDEIHVTRRQLLGAGAGIALSGCVAINPPQAGASVAPQPTDGERFVQLYESVAAAVVQLELPDAADPFATRGGSGFFLEADQLVTNAHVVQDAETVDVRYRDDTWDAGTVLATDLHSDLAVVEVAEPLDDAEPMAPVPEVPPVGREVMAIGAPLGFEGSASAGIVSAVDRSLPSPTGFSIPAAIQTDAAVNPGNSGGPLIDLDGNVVGVIFAATGEGVGFAISGALADRVLPTLQAGEEYDHTYLGVRLIEVTPRLATEEGLDTPRGVYVADVLEGAPADGILQGADQTTGLGGDVILAIDDTEIPSLDALSSYLALETSPGEEVEIRIVRDNEETTVTVELGARPNTVDVTP